MEEKPMKKYKVMMLKDRVKELEKENLYLRNKLKEEESINNALLEKIRLNIMERIKQEGDGNK